MAKVTITIEDKVESEESGEESNIKLSFSFEPPLEPGSEETVTQAQMFGVELMEMAVSMGEASVSAGEPEDE